MTLELHKFILSAVQFLKPQKSIVRMLVHSFIHGLGFYILKAKSAGNRTIELHNRQLMNIPVVYWFNVACTFMFQAASTVHVLTHIFNKNLPFFSKHHPAPLGWPVAAPGSHQCLELHGHAPGSHIKDRLGKTVLWADHQTAER